MNNKMPLNIGIDLDGVVYFQHKLWIQTYNEMFKKNFSFSDIQDWNFYTKENKADWWKALENPFCHLWCETFPDAKRFIKTYAKNHNIMFITTQPSIVKQYKAQRVHNDFKDIDYELFFTKRKQFINWDILIEDNPTLMENEEFLHNCPSDTVLMHRRPYNVRYFDKKKKVEKDDITFILCDNWHEITTQILKYIRERNIFIKDGEYYGLQD